VEVAKEGTAELTGLVEEQRLCKSFHRKVVPDHRSPDFIRGNDGPLIELVDINSVFQVTARNVSELLRYTTGHKGLVKGGIHAQLKFLPILRGATLARDAIRIFFRFISEMVYVFYIFRVA